jgi:hypothetical protein
LPPNPPGGEIEEREATTTLPTPPSMGKNEERKAAKRKASLQSTLRDKRKSLRNKSGCADYTHCFGFTQIAQSFATAAATLEPSSHTELSHLPAVQKAIYGLIFTQMTAQKGIKKHGQAAFEALRKEFEQFRAMDVLEPLNVFELTDKQKAESLRTLRVIKEKRDDKLKGRTVAGKFSKSETGSPTAAIDVVLLTTMIDAYENHSRRDWSVSTRPHERLQLHAFHRMGRRPPLRSQSRILQLRRLRRQNIHVVSGMLWYVLFSQTLEQHSFTINPYDFCVANATIDGTQCTIVWYVDDTKISQVSSSVVTNIIAILESHFRKMSVSSGDRHEFLGMHLHFLGDGTATVHMPSYLQSAIDESGLQPLLPSST